MKSKKTKIFAALAAAVLAGGGALAAEYRLGDVEIPEITVGGQGGGSGATNRVMMVAANYSFWHDENSNDCAKVSVPGYEVGAMRRVQIAACASESVSDYHLGDALEQPEGTDLLATYQGLQAGGEETKDKFLMDYHRQKLFALQGGVFEINWIAADGSTNSQTVTISPTVSGRPYRIFWTEPPYDGPQVDLSGKFVKFFGPKNLLDVVRKPTESATEQMVTTNNQIVSGLYLDPSTHRLRVFGDIQGQVVMAYYDSGAYNRIQHVQVVEIAKQIPNHLKCDIGGHLMPYGDGYNDLESLVASPVAQTVTDDYGEYYYKHTGEKSYSPKHGWLFAIRNTVEKDWMLSVYWKGKDPQNVLWPFELTRYECDWPEDDQKIFVRSSDESAVGEVSVPSDYTAQEMPWSEPQGLNRPLENNKLSTVLPEDADYGWSLLKITGGDEDGMDNVWFMPVKSVRCDDPDYYVENPGAEAVVGKEISYGLECLRFMTTNFFDTVAEHIPLDSEGLIVDGRNYNPRLYLGPGNINTAVTDPETGIISTNTYRSAVYPVTTSSDDEEIEVWWSAEYQLPGMTNTVSAPVLPTRFKVRWPEIDEAPQIALASRKGSGGRSRVSGGTALEISSADATLALRSREYIDGAEATFAFSVNRDNAEQFEGSRALMTFTIDSMGGSRLEFNALADGNYECVAVITNGAREVVCTTGLEGYTNDWVDLVFSMNSTSMCVFANGKCAGYNSTNSITNVTASISVDWQRLTVGARKVGDRTELQTVKGVRLGPIEIYAAALDPEEGYFFDLRELDETFLYWMSACYKYVTVSDVGTMKARGYAWDAFSENEYVELNGMEVVTPGRRSLVESWPIYSDTTPQIYGQNNPDEIGYNPNEEHAFVKGSGDGGWTVWALRNDLNTEDTSRPGVLVEYTEGNRRMMQFFHVVATNEFYREFAGDAVAGKLFGGPEPITLMETPYLAEDKWRDVTSNALTSVYRDRKLQLWARAKGEADVYMYYAMQPGFDFPALAAAPELGTPIPWLSLLERPDEDKAKALNFDPIPWRWRVDWPTGVETMRIGQTLTTAADGLPVVWNAASMAVVYPFAEPLDGEVAAEGYDGRGEDVVRLFDPTAVRKAPIATNGGQWTNVREMLDMMGLYETATLRAGKYYLADLPPSVSGRLYFNTNLDMSEALCLEGRLEQKTGGAGVLYVNVLTEDERDAIRQLVKADNQYKELWDEMFEDFADDIVQPTASVSAPDAESRETRFEYSGRDHYALTAVGGVDYVVLIENDCTNENMVSSSLPINMHVFAVTNDYYTGRIVAREDPENLLSQQLTMLYAESFAGRANDYEFEWRKAAPKLDGTLPRDYDGDYVKDRSGAGITRFTIGQQGDTLDNMVNTYYTMRYKAKDPTVPAYATMGERWSDWCEPMLAEGWVQRVLNRVTPFSQRMQDLYSNAAETRSSMLVAAGAPYTGDVAFNQDNLNNVGLIQLYQTLLNKAESMSICGNGQTSPDANKQLMLAVERLSDMYTVLGDEAFDDANNPVVSWNPEKVSDRRLVSSLFCFDNQVSSLLDEELALLRGRTMTDAPTNTIAPVFNRLMWNFTKGITAGEVAYVMNYNISNTYNDDELASTDNSVARLEAADAAAKYPQGHGDAYGHYLSALSMWYRLLRNPNFDWAVAKGEMTVNDYVVNVDYFEEAKMADAALNVARTAADVVDLTARQAARDSGEYGSGFADANSERAFGYGEWASRGAYGAFMNWMVVNSMLPTVTNETEAAYDDRGLLRINRGSVSELESLASVVKTIQTKVDNLSAGMNPLGFSDRAIPFDITPIGASTGENTHFEQIYERARKAIENADTILAAAQTADDERQSGENETDAINEANVDEERAYRNELIAIYGYPYEGDIGANGTYPQGYDGPDLYHYMWMDPAEYSINDYSPSTNYTVTLYAAADDIFRRNYDVDVDEELEIHYAIGNNGFVVKPAAITGKRRAEGSLQQAYAEYLRAYSDYTSSLKSLQSKEAMLKMTAANNHYTYAKTIYEYVKQIELAFLGAIKDTVVAKADAAIASAKGIYDLAANMTQATVDKIPAVTGAGTTVVLSPQSVAKGMASDVVAFQYQVYKDVLAAQNKIKEKIESYEGERQLEYGVTDLGLNMQETFNGMQLQNQQEVANYNAAVYEAIGKAQQLVECERKIDTLIAEGERLQVERKASRAKTVGKVAKLAYKDMFLRKLRSQILQRYKDAFDIAQKYVYLAAQAYDYETALLSSAPDAAKKFKAGIVAARSLGQVTDGEPQPGEEGDGGLADIMYRLKENWAVVKPRLGINNPDRDTTWFSLREGYFRAETDEEWRSVLERHRVDDIRAVPEYAALCQPLMSESGLAEKEPGFVFRFPSTIDFGKNFFGNDIKSASDTYLYPSHYATKIAEAGVRLVGYNRKAAGYNGAAFLSNVPQVYFFPKGTDKMRSPASSGSVIEFNVVDQVIPLPYAVGSRELDDPDWTPLFNGDTGLSGDAAGRIRKYPALRAGIDTTDLNDTIRSARLVGRSAWNTEWVLIIPAGSMASDREKAMNAFINGSDIDRDGKTDILGASDIQIGLKTYSTSGN